jgi:hypothetical protein
MKSILPVEEAESVLNVHFDTIAKCINDGFEDCQGFISEWNKNKKPINFEKRTIANLVHDFIKGRIKDQYSENENVETKEFNKIFGLHIDKKFLIRFKKINTDFTTSNIKTKQTKNFEKQAEIEGLPKQATFLYAGYIPNPTWTSIKDIFIMCKSGGNIIWVKNLTSFAEQTQFTFENVEIDIAKQSSRVKVKVGEKKATGTDKL